MRLIDAEALMKRICGYECGMHPEDCDGMESKTVPCNYYAYVSEMPTVEPQSAWIPCSERLPDADGNYIVMRADAVEILEYSAEMKLFGFTEEYKDEIGYNITEWYTVGGVSDWMPIPSKEGGDP